MPTLDLPISIVDYRVFGPEAGDAPVAVFVHGFLVSGSLWEPVAERLAADGVRCIVPDWPARCPPPARGSRRGAVAGRRRRVRARPARRSTSTA